MNTKNILIFIFLILFTTGASAQVYHYNAGNMTDSAGILTFKKPVRMMNINQDFGYGSSLWNFRLENDEGTIIWRLNGSRDILSYDDDGHIWDLTGTLKINGVAISSGGGDAYLANRQTFTHRNIFSDTLKADGLSLMEQVRIADWFQVNGDVISNFMFLKGSRVFTGTADSYGYVIKTADTNRLVIDSLGFVTINKSLSAGTYVLATDSVKTEQLNANNIYLGAVNSSIYYRIYGSRIWEGTNSLNQSARTHTFQTKNGNNQIAQLDSATGFNLTYGSYYINGTSIFDTIYTDDKVFKTNNLDTTRFLDLSDTSTYAHTTTGTTESFLSKVIFSALVTFQTTSPVFNIAAVFNVLQDFANGLTTTTLTASGTATFNGDVVFNGFKKVGANNNIDKYTRDTVIRLLCDSVQSGASQIAHGISNTKYIERWSCVIRDDSTGSTFTPGCFYNPYLFYAMVTSSYCRVEFSGSSNTFKRDTAKFYLTISDYNR